MGFLNQMLRADFFLSNPVRADALGVYRKSNQSRLLLQFLLNKSQGIFELNNGGGLFGV
jgi:hypothetical protein